MILRTKVDWLENKELSEQEIAKREVLGKEYEPDEDVYNKVSKNAIIDTGENKLYVEVDEDKICLTPLLNGEFIVADDQVQRMEERLFFESKLDLIYELLTESKIKKIN